MRKAAKLFRALLPRVLDVCVYEYVLSVSPPDILPLVKIDVKVDKQHSQYSFYATHGGLAVNENHIIFKNRLGKQLGYNNVPMLADSNTAESYRGKGIQAFMLTEIARYFALQKGHGAVYVFTYTSNKAMQRALAKAKYAKLYRAKVYRFAGIGLYVRRIYE